MQKYFFLLKKQCFLALLFLLLPLVVSAADDNYDYLFPSRTVYVGANIGGGSTEWSYLVDTKDSGDDPTNGTTPIAVTEGGPSWGVVFGYLVGKNFAIELQYMQFANSHIDINGNTYAEVSCTDEVNYKGCSMVSKTDAYSLSGKLFVHVGKTHMRAFAAVGAGLVQRSDVINHTSAVAPYMSAGLDYNFTRHWILESGFQYYTGFGASEVDPVNDFIPFAWDAYARVAYQF